ncbi:MAG: DUF2312 domain-containing protein [Mesorhizobium sp.]
MAMAVGENSAQRLRGFVERVEHIREQKKQLGDDEKAVMAEAKAEGYVPAAIRYVVKVRAEKPHDRQEREAMQDLYLHAMGMAAEPPLFRFAGLAAVDNTARDQVIEGMKAFVPPHGEGHIDVKFGAATIRLERQKDDTVTSTEVVPKPVQPSSSPTIAPTVPREPVPDVDDAGAFDLGRQYARDNRAVIDNPFPFGDPRRAKFDEGWRRESGGDGMGPEGDD